MTRGLLWLAAMVFTAAVLAPRTSLGNCMGVVGAFPSRETYLPRNGRILLSAGVELQAFAAEIAAYRPVLLASNDRVPLRVAETNAGVETTQALLVPERALRPNQTYRLVLSRGAKVPSTHPSWFRTILGPVAWTTGPASDETPPRWRAPPEPLRPVYHHFGCGPDSYVPINVSFADAEPILIRAEVRGDAEIDRPRRFLLEPSRGAILIGQQECGGAFGLVSNRRYLVTLTAIDLAGNESPAPGGPIEIVAPGPDDEAKRGKRGGR